MGRIVDLLVSEGKFCESLIPVVLLQSRHCFAES